MIPRPRTERASRRGFSFFEVLVASIFLMAGLTFLFSVYRSSNQGALDSYRETIAYCLATEGVEWVAGIGYENLSDLINNPGNSFSQRFKPGEFVEIKDVRMDDNSSMDYPDDFLLFKRMVKVTPYNDKKVILVEVTVQPISSFLRRESVVLSKVVGREYE